MFSSLNSSERFVLASQAMRQACRIQLVAILTEQLTLLCVTRSDDFVGPVGSGHARFTAGYRPYAPYPPSEPCPPCPVCPTCAQDLPAPDPSQQPLPPTDTPPQAAGGGAATSGAGGEPPGGEFEFEDTGEFEFAGNGQREGEYYETDNEFFAAPGNGRSGRWVRRGGKIILTGL